MIKKKRKKPSAGYTIIETLLAFSLILIVITGPITTIAIGLIALAASKNKLIAINLAQEGIELFRVIRENNILCDFLDEGSSVDWLRDPNNPTQRIAGSAPSIREVDASQTRIIQCGSYSIDTPNLPGASGQPLGFNPSTNRYEYGGANQTPFVRTIIVQPPSAPDSEIPSGDQIEVISRVAWKERGADKTVELKQRFYYWR